MKDTETQAYDKSLLEKSVNEFQAKAKKKIQKRIKKHNRNSKKEICMMSMKDRITSAKNEVLDLWIYLCAIEDAAEQTRTILLREGLIKPTNHEDFQEYLDGHIRRSSKL